jgi:hypothetical protein
MLKFTQTAINFIAIETINTSARDMNNCQNQGFSKFQKTTGLLVFKNYLLILT